MLVVNVGRLVPEKAQDVLLDAFRRLAPESAAGARLLIAGEGPERATLTATIARLGLTANATLLGARRDITALLNAADLFVLSSRMEGMPLAIAEALACGCPVVATDAPGVADLLGDAGTIVPRDDAAALAVAMQAALRSGLGSPAQQAMRRKRIVSRFSIDAVARQWLSCYARLATGTAAARAEPA
jgi:glycosyltransferase involved in cell wall biosynthesis